MDKSINEINQNLVRFWDEAMTLSKEESQSGQKIGDYSELAPAQKLFLAAKELGQCQRVLDYGCGTGWASIVAAKEGCPEVIAADLGQHILETLSFYATMYGVKEAVKPTLITDEWLKQMPEGAFNGIVCSNVLDVVPLETGEEIIKFLARVANKDARVVIGLNFFLDPEVAEKRGMELEDGTYLFVNGVLRLTNLSDDAWRARFDPFFEIEKLDYFAWPGEKAETRRLFVLRRI